jgi:TRAP-type C4-dicarboxylate transport system substrate-binding protein
MDGGVLVSDFAAGEIPFFNFTSLPMLVTNVGEQAKVRPILQPYVERELKKRGLTLLFPRYVSQKDLYGRGKAIKNLNDLKGRKVRTFGLADSEFLKRLGAIPVSMPGIDVSTALQRGVMDAFLGSAFFSASMHWDELTDWGYLMDITAITSYECVNSNSLAKLSAANRKILFDTAAKYERRCITEVLELENNAQKKFTGKDGKQLIKMTPKDRVRATELIKSFWGEWAKSVGPDAVEALRKVRGVLGK